MSKIFDSYKEEIESGEVSLINISFQEYMYANALRFRDCGFSVEEDEEAINRILDEMEKYWESSKHSIIEFPPQSIERVLRFKIDNHKDEINNEMKIELREGVSCSFRWGKSKLKIEEIIEKYDKLKIKENYIFYIYEIESDIEKKKCIFAIKNDKQKVTVGKENFIDTYYEGIRMNIKESEFNYMSGIEHDGSAEGYLQAVLLKLELEKLCFNQANFGYELIVRKTIIDDNMHVDGPKLWVNDDNKYIIEYFTTFQAEDGTIYKRIINIFNDNDSAEFKKVDEIILIMMN